MKAPDIKEFERLNTFEWNTNKICNKLIKDRNSISFVSLNKNKQNININNNIIININNSQSETIPNLNNIKEKQSEKEKIKTKNNSQKKKNSKNKITKQITQVKNKNSKNIKIQEYSPKKYIKLDKIKNNQIPKDYLNIIYYNLLKEEHKGVKPMVVYNYMTDQNEINEKRANEKCTNRLVNRCPS